MASETKLVGQLTDAERARLCEIVEWYECPLCKGQSVNFDDGKFCGACTNTGKLLSPTANILNNMKALGYIDDADHIASLEAEVAALRTALSEARKWIVGRPDILTSDYSTNFAMIEAIDALLRGDGNG